MALACVALPVGEAGAMTIDLRSGDSSRTVHLRRGDTVRITLAENQSTPYRWRFARRPSSRVLRLVKSEYIVPPMPPGQVGGGGKHVYTFRAIRRGRTSLRLVESLFGEPRTIARRFSLSVRPG